MAALFFLPTVVAVDSSGTPYAGAKLEFFVTGTSTQTDVYTDAALTTPHDNPVVADAAGVFAPIYLDPNVVYKATLSQSDDTLIDTFDPASADPGMTSTTNGTLSMTIDNDSNGTANAARLVINSGDASSALFTAGSGRTSAVLTGGPTGAQVVLRALGNYPLILGTNNTLRMNIAGDGTVTIGGEYVATSDGDTGGSGSAGGGAQYVELNINGTVYKVLHDGTV